MVSTFTSWISYPLLSFWFCYDFDVFFTLLIAKSNGWNTWVRFAGTNTVTKWFSLIKSKTRWVNWALKTSKMSMYFCFSTRSNSALFDLANEKIIDSRCLMTLSSLLQWYCWILQEIQYLWGDNGWFYFAKLVALVRIFQTLFTKK